MKLESENLKAVYIIPSALWGQRAFGLETLTFGHKAKSIS